MKRIFLITFLSIFIFKVYGQDNIGTPYSVYGIGLQTENAGPYNAMGGVAAAMRDNGNINYLNPASYTALDRPGFISNSVSRASMPICLPTRKMQVTGWHKTRHST